jgi:hypothetical protein
MAPQQFRRDLVRKGLKRTTVGSIAFAAMMAFAVPAATAADQNVDGTATLSGTGISLVTPTTLEFSAELTGVDQVIDSTQALDVLDNSGTAAGWGITLTSTTFTNGADNVSLADDAASDSGATGACDTVDEVQVTCTKADNPDLGVVAIPAASTAPDAVLIMSAGAGSGMGPQTWTHNMHLAIPANTHAGTYLSTWTYSLVSAP